MTVGWERAIAMITASLHVGDMGGIASNIEDPAGAREWLARVRPITHIIAELARDAQDDASRFHDTIRELVEFAATAVDGWARSAGEDPARLLQELALQRATRDQ